jgi:protein O-mannosyl-transferase
LKFSIFNFRFPFAGRSRSRFPPASALLSLALALATLATFHPALHSGFINCDDNEYITDNPHVRTGLSAANVWWAFAAAHSSNWHPLTWLSHSLDCQWYGLNPWGHHLTSVLLHAANALLLFLLLQRLTKTFWRSALVAALFALHPTRVESVAWVAERKDVLSAFFFMLTLLAYTSYVRIGDWRRARSEVGPNKSAKSVVAEPEGSAAAEHAKHAEDRAGDAGIFRVFRVFSGSRFEVQGSRFKALWPAPSSILHPLSSPAYLLALFCFALGLMSKSMLVTLPFLLLLLDFWPLARMKKFHPSSLILHPLLLEKVPFFVLSALSCVVTFVVQQRSGMVQPLAGLSAGERLANALFSYTRYLGKTLWPADLAFPYPHPGRWPLEAVLISAAVLTAVSAVALLSARSRPYLLVGWLWFVGTLIPVIGLVQVGTQSMADHYTYLPLVGLFLAFVWAVADCSVQSSRFGVRGQPASPPPSSILHPPSSSSALLGLLAALVLLSCAALTRAQVHCWRDSETLFRHTLAVTKGNYIAHKQLGDCLLENGRLEEASASYRDALLLKPDYMDALHNLGITLKRAGKFDEAVACFLTAWRAKPGFAEALNKLGCELAGRGQFAPAGSCFAAALKAKPDFAEARNNLGNALAGQGRLEEAAESFRRALRLNPNSADTLNNLGCTLAAMTQYNAAIINYQAALRLAPAQPLIHFHLGCALAAVGRGDEAAAHLREALRLKPDYAAARDQLRVLGIHPPD